MTSNIHHLLEQVIDITTQLQRLAPVEVDDNCTSNYPASPSNLTRLSCEVPHSHKLSSILTAKGVPLHYAEELSDIHTRRCSELVDEYTEAFNSIWQQLTTTLSSKSEDERARIYKRLQGLHMRMYDKTVEQWVSDLLQSPLVVKLVPEAKLQRTFNSVRQISIIIFNVPLRIYESCTGLHTNP